MYRRLIILSVIVIAALCGLSWLGYRAVSMWIQGIEGTRITEFANVAEQIRLDVKYKLDTFMEGEQSRPYTDYQYYSVPEEPYLAQQKFLNEGVNFERQINEPVADQREQQGAANNFSPQYGNNANVLTLMRSPLADNLEHGLAYFNFQVDQSNNMITTPNGRIEQQQAQLQDGDVEELNDKIVSNSMYVRDNLLPILNKKNRDLSPDNVEKEKLDQKDLKEDNSKKLPEKYSEFTKAEDSEEAAQNKAKAAIEGKGISGNNLSSKGVNRSASYNIESLQNQGAKTQIQTQSRNYIMTNEDRNAWADASQQPALNNQSQQLRAQSSQASSEQMETLRQQLTNVPSQSGQQAADIPAQTNGQQEINMPAQADKQQSMVAHENQQPGSASAGRGAMAGGMGGSRGAGGGSSGEQVVDFQTGSPQTPGIQNRETVSTRTAAGKAFVADGIVQDNVQSVAQTPVQEKLSQQADFDSNRADLVEVRIEPFVPVFIPAKNNKETVFGGQVYMIRRVTYEGKELIQGFQLNDKKLLEEIEASTKRFMREGMSYELGRNQNEHSAYTAILDFGFGHLLLNLFENNPGRFIAQISHLRMWYFSIISVVFLAVTLAMASLWLSARAQLKLAQKKDDFVSAVSHELRTPLTSIRMHAEMLEKNWIKSENKLGEYYKSMRQESERLSRLIENVLDFSRIQKKQKKYLFKLGDINKCVADVVEMMASYAAQRGFRINVQPGDCGQITFDSDAVTQIVVNLVDNAVKYAAKASDKTITVRTKLSDGFVLIDVEDHGPGIPHRQRKKVFQEFYRIGAEATRETTGSGLGLALVKKFAQAHNGFVEILSARPTGAILRVSLAATLQQN